MQKKVFKCCICDKVLKEYKPIRLVKQVHDNKVPYGAYHFERSYDFCKECYNKFDNWIRRAPNGNK